MNFRKTEHHLHRRVAIRLHERGMLVKEICALFGITHVSLYNWLKHLRAVIE